MVTNEQVKLLRQKRMEGKKMSPEMEKELAKAQGELIRQAMDYSAK